MLPKIVEFKNIFLGIIILMVLLHVPQTISLLLASCAPNSLICTRYSIFLMITFYLALLGTAPLSEKLLLPYSLSV